jgi:hypothetical protein
MVNEYALGGEFSGRIADFGVKVVMYRYFRRKSTQPTNLVGNKSDLSPNHFP